MEAKKLHKDGKYKSIIALGSLYPGLVLLLLLVQLGLIHTRSVQIKPQRLRYPGQQRRKQRGHFCHTTEMNPIKQKEN